MKRVISNRLVIAGLALLAVPSFASAQDAKKDETVQTIVITRTGDKNEKINIEVDGDKIKVNGKDLKDLKDINVNVNTNVHGRNFYRAPSRGGTYNFDLNGNSLFHTDENRAMLGVNTDNHEKGAAIQSITEGSAAEKAGLKKGDIITRVGDTKIEDADDLTEAIQSHKPGAKVGIAYLRDGKEQKATAELGKWKGISMQTVPMPKLQGLMEQWRTMEPAQIAPLMNQNAYFFSGRPRLGLSIEDTDDAKGVKVLEVDEESNAAKAGIKKDDIILGIDDKEVKGTEDVMKIIRDNKEKHQFNFKVLRNGKTQNIEVRFPRKLKKADL